MVTEEDLRKKVISEVKEFPKRKERTTRGWVTSYEVPDRLVLKALEEYLDKKGKDMISEMYQKDEKEKALARKRDILELSGMVSGSLFVFATMLTGTIFYSIVGISFLGISVMDLLER